LQRNELCRLDIADLRPNPHVGRRGDLQVTMRILRRSQIAVTTNTYREASSEATRDALGRLSTEPWSA
jgi:hypothetical protein